MNLNKFVGKYSFFLVDIELVSSFFLMKNVISGSRVKRYRRNVLFFMVVSRKFLSFVICIILGELLIFL